MAYASRQSSYILGSVGAVVQVLAAWWDVYSHLVIEGVDPWWNPAHLTLYSGFAITIVAIWQGLRSSKANQVPPLSPINFRNLAGLRIAALGTVVEVVAGGWNEIGHRILFHQPVIEPAHALLTFGLLIVIFGMVVGLTVEYGLIKHEIITASAFRRLLTYACLVWAFAGIWLTAAGSLIYTGAILRDSLSNLLIAALLATIASLVLVPAKKALPRFGTALAIGLIFNGVSYFFLLQFVHFPPFVPWGLIPMLLFDGLIVGLNRIEKNSWIVPGSAFVIGLLFWATYYPFTLRLLPWSIAQQVFVILGCAGGAMLGNKIYSQVTSVVLRGISELPV